MRETMKRARWAIVLETTKTGCSVYVPDLPGCIATGKTRASVQREIGKAIRFHLDGMLEDGIKAPKPTSVCEYVEA